MRALIEVYLSNSYHVHKSPTIIRRPSVLSSSLSYPEECTLSGHLVDA